MNRGRKRRRLLIRRAEICLCFALLVVILTAGIGECAKVLRSESTKKSPPIKTIQVPSSAVSSAKAPSAVSSQRPSTQTSSLPPAKVDPGGPPKPESWFNDAVFIGDSRTQGLQNYDGLGDATYFAVKGLMVNTAYTQSAIRLNGNKLTVMQAMKRKKFGKVYIMLGVNELGWSSFQMFVNDYGQMIDDIRKDQPGATIYLQSILPVTEKESTSNSVYNNKKIQNYNQAIQKLAAQRKVKYLAVCNAVADISGALPANAATDGIHLDAQYCKKWCDYLKTHTD